MEGGTVIYTAGTFSLDIFHSKFSAGYGGVMIAFSSSFNITNCTFTNNRAELDGVI